MNGELLIPLAAGWVAFWFTLELQGVRWASILAPRLSPEVEWAADVLGWSGARYVVLRLAASAVAAASVVFLIHPAAGLPAGWLVFRGFPAAVVKQAQRRKALYEGGLPALCEYVAVSLAAGRRLGDALAYAVSRVPEPLSREMRRVMALLETDPVRVPGAVRALGTGLGPDARAVLDRLARAFESGIAGPEMFSESAENLRRLWAEREKAKTRMLPLELLAGAGLGVLGLGAAGLYLLAMWAVETAKNLASF